MAGQVADVRDPGEREQVVLAVGFPAWPPGPGAKRGILFQNATALEETASLDTAVFDKTGT